MIPCWLAQLADQRGFTEIVEYLASKAEQISEKTEDKEAKETKGEADALKVGGTNARRGAVLNLNLYKGLQEKAANREKERLSLAAQLAETRHERWLQLREEVKKAIASEALAKAHFEEAMRAQAAIAAGNKQRRSSMLLQGAPATIVMAATPRSKHLVLEEDNGNPAAADSANVRSAWGDVLGGVVRRSNTTCTTHSHWKPEMLRSNSTSQPCTNSPRRPDMPRSNTTNQHSTNSPRKPEIRRASNSFISDKGYGQGEGNGAPSWNIPSCLVATSPTPDR